MYATETLKAQKWQSSLTDPKCLICPGGKIV